jgi:hypothetical protein
MYFYYVFVTCIIVRQLIFFCFLKPLSDRSIVFFGNIITDNPIPEFLLAQADGNESIVGSILPLGLQPLGSLH